MNHAAMTIEFNAGKTKPGEPLLSAISSRNAFGFLAAFTVFVSGTLLAPDEHPHPGVLIVVLVLVSILTWAALFVVGHRQHRRYAIELTAWERARNDMYREEAARVEAVQDRMPALRLETSWGVRFTPGDEPTWYDEYAHPQGEARSALTDSLREGLDAVLLRRERVATDWSAPHHVTDEEPTPLVDGAAVDVIQLELRCMTGTLEVDRDGAGRGPAGHRVPLALHDDVHGGWVRLHPVDEPMSLRGWDRAHIIVPAPRAADTR